MKKLRAVLTASFFFGLIMLPVIFNAPGVFYGGLYDSPATPCLMAAFLALLAFLALCVIVFVIPWLWSIIPGLWRGTLHQTNQLSRAVQGKLDDPPNDKNSGAGI
jgi:hypothetical protein